MSKSYLVTMYKYSQWLEIKLLSSTSVAAVINRLKDIIYTQGVMHTLNSDNGPQYVSAEFKEFAARYGFQQSTSSPQFPQANGAAERVLSKSPKRSWPKMIPICMYSITQTQCTHPLQ